MKGGEETRALDARMARNYGPWIGKEIGETL